MQWRIQDFPKEGALTPKGGPPTYYLANFSRKLHENEEILGRGGGARPTEMDMDEDTAVFASWRKVSAEFCRHLPSHWSLIFTKRTTWSDRISFDRKQWDKVYMRILEVNKYVFISLWYSSTIVQWALVIKYTKCRYCVFRFSWINSGNRIGCHVEYWLLLINQCTLNKINTRANSCRSIQSWQGKKRVCVNFKRTATKPFGVNENQLQLSRQI